MLLLQSGMNPLKLPLLLLGEPLVLIGSLILVAVLQTPHHALTQTLLGADGRADFATRALLIILSLILILTPFAFLTLNALQRLAVYQPILPK